MTQPTKSENGLITVASSFPAQETARRLEAAITKRGLTLFARIDHAANAASANLPLRPTEVFIFGNARGGTPLMQDKQSAGIDLPLKMLLWEDAEGRVSLSYNSPTWIAQRHGLGAASAAPVAAMTAALDVIAREAGT
jgi:uncharacterized protein (DUF302 family)